MLIFNKYLIIFLGDIANMEDSNKKNSKFGLKEYGDNKKIIIDSDGVEYKFDDYEENETKMYKANRNKFNNGKIRGSFLAYVLGLIGSIFSLVICILIMQVMGLFNRVIYGSLSNGVFNFFNEIFYYDSLVYFGDFVYGIINIIMRFGFVIFLIILVGSILGIISSIKSFNDVSIPSASVMIVSGVCLLFCFLIPGVFLIVGGILNIQAVLDSKK